MTIIYWYFEINHMLILRIHYRMMLWRHILISVSNRNYLQARQGFNLIVTRVENVSIKLYAYTLKILWLTNKATKKCVKCIYMYMYVEIKKTNFNCPYIVLSGIFLRKTACFIRFAYKKLVSYFFLIKKNANIFFVCDSSQQLTKLKY